MLVISVSSLKGGVGKTSVALGLASAAHHRGIPTLVVDMDPQADASTGLDVPVTTPLDIADVLSAPKAKIVAQAIVPSGWSGGAKGALDVIPGSPRSAEFDRPTLSERFLRRLRDALATVADDYRLVIIDCPPSMNGLTRSAWMASQRVAVVTEPGLFSVAAADRALRAIAELRRRGAPDLQPLGLIANRVRVKSREHAFRVEEMREMFGPLVLTPPIGERTVLQQAQGSARPIHSWPGQSSSELAGAFDALLDRALRTSSIRSRDQLRDADTATGAVSAPASDESGPAASDTDAPVGVSPGQDAPVGVAPDQDGSVLAAAEHQAPDPTTADSDDGSAPPPDSLSPFDTVALGDPATDDTASGDSAPDAGAMPTSPADASDASPADTATAGATALDDPLFAQDPPAASEGTSTP